MPQPKPQSKQLTNEDGHIYCVTIPDEDGKHDGAGAKAKYIRASDYIHAEQICMAHNLRLDGKLTKQIK